MQKGLFSEHSYAVFEIELPETTSSIVILHERFVRIWFRLKTAMVQPRFNPKMGSLPFAGFDNQFFVLPSTTNKRFLLTRDLFLILKITTISEPSDNNLVWTISWFSGEVSCITAILSYFSHRLCRTCSQNLFVRPQNLLNCLNLVC